MNKEWAYLDLLRWEARTTTGVYADHKKKETKKEGQSGAWRGSLLLTQLLKLLKRS